MREEFTQRQLQLGAVKGNPPMMLAFVMALVGVAVLGTLNLVAARQG